MLQQLKQERVFAHFFEICRYPHPSHHEQELSCYLYDWAKELGLEVYQDEAWNLIIKKPASPEYGTHPTVLLQAHIDMVCQKEELVEMIQNSDFDVLVLLGAGDIENYASQIAQILKDK